MKSGKAELVFPVHLCVKEFYSVVFSTLIIDNQLWDNSYRNIPD